MLGLGASLPVRADYVLCLRGRLAALVAGADSALRNPVPDAVPITTGSAMQAFPLN
jgi:hypothetical protein